MPQPGVGPDTSDLWPGSEVALSDARRGQLLDTSLWREALERYAQATNLAVVLTDAVGNPVGSCLNPRPTWLVLQAPKPAGVVGCPFAVMPLRPCTCIADALATGCSRLLRDRVGLVHFAVPLRLGDQPLGAVVAGQVFDRFPEQLVLEHVAQQSGVSPQAAWNRARLEQPVKGSTLQVYADLLATLANDRLRSHYHWMSEADRLAALSRLSDQLREAHDELERRVCERTAELQGALAALAEQIAQRREFQQRLVRVEEGERRRLSRELHDETSQLLCAAGLELSRLVGSMPEDSPERERLKWLQRLVRQLSNDLHRIATELRPPTLDDIGLPELLQAYLNEWSVRTGIQVEFVSVGFESPPPSDVDTTIYRIVQEALTNVARHAGAGCVSVVLETSDGHAGLIVKDDGRGFDVDAALAPHGATSHLGLLGMRERLDLVGGTLTIESGPGGPTTLHISVPTTQGST
jgi:signal transduction histidine kinase